jgi:hypothetical protein
MKKGVIVLVLLILMLSADAVAQSRFGRNWSGIKGLTGYQGSLGKFLSERDRVLGGSKTLKGSSASLTKSQTDSHGTVSTEITVTGPKGQTATLSSTTSKTDDGITQNATYTGPGGKTITESSSVTKTGNTTNGEVTITGPQGQTSSFSWSRTVVTQPSETQ